MFRCFDLPPAPTLEHFTEIDRQTIVAGRHIEPGAAAMSSLQTRDSVLRQEREKTGIDVWRAIDVKAPAAMAYLHAGICSRRFIDVGPKWIAQQPQCG